MYKFPESFASKVEVTDSCWLWKNFKNKDGYGQYRFKKKNYLTHRLAWSLVNGDIPSGMYILHKCDTPACVNPEHLFLGTQSENMKDMFSKGRASNKGINHPGAKLNESQVREIREKYVRYKHGKNSDYSLTGLSKVYGVSITLISKIIKKQVWSEVE